jgi:hypothetical protein
LSTDSQDRVYIFRRRQEPPVVVCDRDGNYLSSWGHGTFIYPHGFYIANDIVYLTDRDASVCMTYTLDGKPIQTLGKHGVHSDTGCAKENDPVPRPAGPFNHPTKLVPSPWGDLYVSDGHRNARGSPLRQWRPSDPVLGHVGPGPRAVPHSPFHPGNPR